jgi:hypothetical protein
MVAPLIYPKIQLFVSSFFLILENACCNGLHHFPLILLLLKDSKLSCHLVQHLGYPYFELLITFINFEDW